MMTSKIIFMFNVVKSLLLVSMMSSIMLVSTAVHAEDNHVLSAIDEYMEFTEYSSSLIWPEQIPKSEWKKIFVIDARDAKQYKKENIPGSINIEWRKVVARKSEIPADRMVVIYCNSGSLSAQSVFALMNLELDMQTDDHKET